MSAQIVPENGESVLWQPLFVQRRVVVVDSNIEPSGVFIFLVCFQLQGRTTEPACFVVKTSQIKQNRGDVGSASISVFADQRQEVVVWLIRRHQIDLNDRSKFDFYRRLNPLFIYNHRFVC